MELLLKMMCKLGCKVILSRGNNCNCRTLDSHWPQKTLFQIHTKKQLKKKTFFLTQSGSLHYQFNNRVSQSRSSKLFTVTELSWLDKLYVL